MLIEKELQTFLLTVDPLFESAFDPVCIVDLSGKVVHFNRVMRELLRKSAAELREQPALATLICFDPSIEDRPLSEHLTSTCPFMIESAVATISDQKHVLSLHGVPIYSTSDTAQTTPIGMLLQFRNETPQAEFQHKYRILLRSVLGILDNGEEIRRLKDSLAEPKDQKTVSVKDPAEASKEVK